MDQRSLSTPLPWDVLGTQALESMRRVLPTLVTAETTTVLIGWDDSPAGLGVVIDTDHRARAFEDGPIDPQSVLDASELQLDEETPTCLTFLCAEVLLQNIALITSRAPEWRIVVRPGHDEPLRIVTRKSEPTESLFDDKGRLLALTTEERIKRADDSGQAIAALFPIATGSGDSMALLGRVDAVFLRVAKGQKTADSRAEVTALVEALAEHHQRLGLQGWGESYEQVLSKAVVCTQDDRASFDLLTERVLMPLDEVQLGNLAFNLACVHARFGSLDETLDATQRALQLGATVEQFDDSDFDGVRDDPRFLELLNGPPDEERLTRELGEAAEALDVEKVESLLAAGADPAGEYEGDPLVFAAFSGSARNPEKQARRRAIVERLLEAGSDPGKRDWPWLKILGDTALLDFLLSRSGKVSTGLIKVAAEQEDLQTLERLVRHGVKLSEHVQTLQSACRHHRKADTLRFLVAQGVNLASATKNNPFVLDLASAGNVMLLDVARELGLDLHARDGGGGSLISHALFNDKHEVVRWALVHGARLDVQDTRGVGLVHAAVLAGASESLPLLLEAGAPVDLKDAEGRTALDAAVEANRGAFVKLLQGS